jgi:heptosyltransferase I
VSLSVSRTINSPISEFHIPITRLSDYQSTQFTMRILLVRLRQIGDVVFTTPAIHALRQEFPHAHLTYLVEPAAAPVVISNPRLDEVIVAPRGAGLRGFVHDLVLGQQLRSRRYDVTIDFHGGPRASLLTWLSRAPKRIGYQVIGRSWMYTHRVARPRRLRSRHSVENQWDLLTALNMPSPDRSRFPVEMAVQETAARVVAERLASVGVQPSDILVVIHVSAGNPFRRWPIGHFVQLVAALVRRRADLRVIITAGPSERPAADGVIAEARSALGEAGGQVLSCGEFALAELRALLEHAALFIGGDSGPLHIAATTRVPVVGLYGPTLPIRSAPWRDKRWTTLSVDAGELPCRPCNQRVCTPGDFRCLTSIAPDRVFEAATQALEGARADKMSASVTADLHDHR